MLLWARFDFLFVTLMLYRYRQMKRLLSLLIVYSQVEAGTLRLGDEVQIAPTRKKAKVEGIYIGDDSVRLQVMDSFAGVAFLTIVVCVGGSCQTGRKCTN